MPRPEKPPRQRPAVTQIENTMALTKGVVSISYPSRISGDDIEDIEAWLALMLKRINRQKG